LGTTTESTFLLDVNGTARVSGVLTVTGSTTASSAIARGLYVNSTLVAAANNDVLVGLDISNTYTNGAFTGVTNFDIRTSNFVLRNGSDYTFINRSSSSSGRIQIMRPNSTVTTAISIGGGNDELYIRDSSYQIRSSGSVASIDSTNTTAFALTVTGSEGTKITSTNGVSIGTSTFISTSILDIGASTTAKASLRIRTGVAPTTPNDGDIWQDGTDIKIRIGGVTKTFTLV
jgi:hypothetical protein